MDKELYMAVKQLEIAVHNLFVQLPQEDSALYNVLDIQQGAKWRFGCLIDQLCWLQNHTKNIGTRIFMEGKD